MSLIRIVMASDEPYAPHLATALRSLAEANSHIAPLEVHVLSSDIKPATRERVEQSVPAGSLVLVWHDIDITVFGSFSTAHYVSKMTFARLLIPKLLPETVDRVLYLDTDLLVLQNLERLWAVDLEGAVIGAVLDILDPLVKVNRAAHPEVPDVGAYFNAGVLLIDLNRWRAERVSERALEYLAQHPRTTYMDQDALNVVCDGHWKSLDSRWNYQAHVWITLAEQAREALPGIVHFTMSCKPWKPSSISQNAAFYDAFRRRTRFARTRSDILRDGFERLSYRIARKFTVLRQSFTVVRKIADTSAS